jgi:ATP-binding cassette subfamily B protein
MKEGFCQAIAANSAIADGEGTPTEQIAEEAVLFVLDTSIDLVGNPCRQRLTIGERQLMVSDLVGNRQPERRRQWRWEQIEAFRVEPAVGSHFLQVQVDEQWIDVLRRPGDAARELTDLVGRLNARCGQDFRETAGGSENATRRRSDVRLGDSRSETKTPPGWLGSAAEIKTPARLRMTARLWALLRPFRGSVVLLLVLSLGAVAIDMTPPILLKVLVDRVLQADRAQNPLGQLLQLLLAIVAGLLLARLAATLVAVWKGWVSSRVGTTLTSDLRTELVSKLNQLPLAFYDRNQAGVLMSQVAYDTETLHTLVYHMTSGFLMQSLQLAGIGVMLLCLNAKLALVTLLPMPLIVAGSWYFTRYLQPRHQHYWAAVGKQASALMGMLTGIRVVKAFVQEDREIRRFADSSRRLRDSRLTVDNAAVTFTAAMGLLFALGGLVVWYLGGRDVLFGSMTFGSLMAFLAFLAMFYAPLTTIAESTTWFASFYSTSRRICALLDVPNESEQAQPTAPLGLFHGGVEFQHVSFAYDRSRPVLEDISFTIEPGEMVGVVGRSGSGKSTLVSLIGRLYECNAGQIRIDGIDVRQMNPRQLRRQIGMVPQEPFLFRGSVAANITYGDGQAAPEQILLAARNADSHEFIMRMPFAYETQLGEGGSGLSGGERQRLSIARALLFDPAILILDEATASVDAESERAICRAIRRWARAPYTHGRRTTIVIAHRLSTLQGADRLLVFDQGRLVEQGTPVELLRQGGLYSTLASIQYNLNEGRRRFESAAGGDAASGIAEAAAEWGDGESLFQATAANVPAPDTVREPAANGRDANREPEIAWLDPAGVTIEDNGRGLLRVGGRQRNDSVQAVWAFPASEEGRFISLRYREPSGRETEVGMLHTLAAWPRRVQEAIRRSLARRYLIRRIEEIRQVVTSGSQLALSVLTDGGPAKLRLEKPGEGCQEFGAHGLLLTDPEGNYYVIRDRGALPRRQQRLLTLYFGD